MKDLLSPFPVAFDQHDYSFGEFRLEHDGTLWRGRTVVHLPPKELAALCLLLKHAGQIVTPLQLRNSLWGEIHVSTDSISKCLSSLRARLEPDQPIQTVYKRGYRFTAAVSCAGFPSREVLPRLAIMPFTTGYSVPEYLGPAIAEEAMLQLTIDPHPVVAIMARDSVFALAERKQTAQQIGQTLKADLVLTGTLRCISASFRLRAEMIRPKDGTQLWVEEMLLAQSHFEGIEADLVQSLVKRIHSRILSIGFYHSDETPKLPAINPY
jgi:DNA-binding winged helix-turn-helix (wHTH) protein